MLRAVRARRRDIADTGLFLHPGEDIAGVEIELTYRVSTVSGVVRGGGTDSSFDQYSVVLFPQDRTLWRTANVGRNALVLPDQNGVFQIPSIRPGSYFIAALAYIDPADSVDPDYLQELSRTASKFSIAEGEAKKLNLRPDSK